MIDVATVSMPFPATKTSAAHFYAHGSSDGGVAAGTAGSLAHSSAVANIANLGGVNAQPPMTASSTAIGSSSGGSLAHPAPIASGVGGGTSNMSSMVGSAISVIPGTTLINNLFGKVFTLGDNSSNISAAVHSDARHSESWICAQKELIKWFPSVLAILCDVWSYATSKVTLLTPHLRLP